MEGEVKDWPWKSLDNYWSDWHDSLFPFGYGSGEPHIIPPLRQFLALCEVRHSGGAPSYEYEKAEQEISPAVTWFIINALCKADAIEYGSSPRFGWLTPKGVRLRDYVLTKTADELVALACTRGEDHDPCCPDACNCGPGGYKEGRVCQNPFWLD